MLWVQCGSIWEERISFLGTIWKLSSNEWYTCLSWAYQIHDWCMYTPVSFLSCMTTCCPCSPGSSFEGKSFCQWVSIEVCCGLVTAILVLRVDRLRHENLFQGSVAIHTFNRAHANLKSIFFVSHQYVEINCACLHWLDMQEDMVFSCTPRTSPLCSHRHGTSSLNGQHETLLENLEEKTVNRKVFWCSTVLRHSSLFYRLNLA
jgi:hypothetical protein